MATNNAINLRSAGVPIYNDTTGVFSGVSLTKGQLLSFDGTNYGAFAVGSNGQFLQAQSAQTYGLQWVTAAIVSIVNVVTGTTTIAPNNIYIVNNATIVTFTLPTTAAVGTSFEVIGNGAGGWIIEQGSGQNINFGSLSTTPGVGGSIASTDPYDCLRAICTVADTTWSVNGTQGNMTVV